MLRFLKLEATWILTNLCYGEDDEIQTILDFKFGQNQSFTTTMSSLLKQNFDDIAMVDQILFIMGNLLGSPKEIKRKIMADFDLVQIMT